MKDIVVSFWKPVVTQFRKNKLAIVGDIKTQLVA